MTVRMMTRRRAFTLAELMVSMAVSVVLLGGLASALVISSHAMPDGDSPSRGLLDGATAAEQIAADLLCARSFTQFSQTVVEFTVADRNHGAGGPETIRYAWSEIVGDPLTRQYNGGIVANVLDNVSEFALTYDLRALNANTPPTSLLRRVRIGIRAGGPSSALVETATEVLNQPVVIGP